jgi:hypothetical protein
MENEKIICCCCGKQAIKEIVNINDPYITTLKGAKPAFKQNEVFCGYCAEDLDENGLFQEEK